MQVVKGEKNLSTLTEAYLTVTYGYDEPDILRCHPIFAKWIYQKISETQKSSIPTFPKEEDGRVLQFMNSTLKFDLEFPEDRIRFENSAHPKGTPHSRRFTCEVEFTDG